MRILFCSLDSAGFLFPMIGLALELGRRGHEVGFVTNRTQARRLAEVGLERLPRGEVDGDSFQTPLWYDVASIAIQVKHVEHALERFSADVLVGQLLGLGPVVVADRQSLPLVQLGLLTYIWPSFDDEAEDARRFGPAYWRRWRYEGFVEKLNQVRCGFHLPVVTASCRETPLLGERFLLRSVPGVERDIELLPDPVSLVGPCLWHPDEEVEQLRSWLDSTDRPILYVQQGRHFQLPSFWDAVRQASAEMGLALAADLGKMESGSTPETGPNAFVRNHLSQDEVLPRAALVICSANTTATLGAFVHGVPSLLIPGGGEQPDVAALAADLGLGISIGADELRLPVIKEAIRRLLHEDRFRQAGVRVRELFAGQRSFGRAADAVEETAARS